MTTHASATALVWDTSDMKTREQRLLTQHSRVAVITMWEEREKRRVRPVDSQCAQRTKGQAINLYKAIVLQEMSRCRLLDDQLRNFRIIYDSAISMVFMLASNHPHQVCS